MSVVGGRPSLRPGGLHHDSVSVFAAVYGPEWGFLGQATPCSTVLAAGAEIAVYPKGKLTV